MWLLRECCLPRRGVVAAAVGVQPPGEGSEAVVEVEAMALAE
jgi:hypothetical protein